MDKEARKRALAAKLLTRLKSIRVVDGSNSNLGLMADDALEGFAARYAGELSDATDEIIAWTVAVFRKNHPDRFRSESEVQRAKRVADFEKANAPPITNATRAAIERMTAEEKLNLANNGLAKKKDKL